MLKDSFSSTVLIERAFV